MKVTRHVLKTLARTALPAIAVLFVSLFAVLLGLEAFEWCK